MNRRDERVDRYLDKQVDWKARILNSIRETAEQCDVEEGIKWGIPTYMNKGNVFSFAAFKNHVALWFYQGVFLNDEVQVLETSDGTSEGLRQWRFYEGDEPDLAMVKVYMEEAIANSLQGKKIKPKPQKKQDPLPEAFEKALKQNPKAKSNFEGMSISKRNEFIRHISSAKQEATVLNRIEKAIGYLEQNLDLNHKYRK